MITRTPNRQPWDEAADHLRSGDTAALAQLLQRLGPSDTARTLAHLTHDESVSLLRLLPVKEAAEVLYELPVSEAGRLLPKLDEADAVRILRHLSSSTRADILGALDEADSNRILSATEPAEASALRRLLSYPPHTAGGLMNLEFLSYRETMTIGEVIDDLRTHGSRYSDFAVQYAYVVDQQRRLHGVLRLRDLLLSPPGEPLHRVMIPTPRSLSVQATLDELLDFFKQHAFLGAPVVDADGSLIGIVRRVDVENAAKERSSRLFLRLSGIVGGEEFRNMPVVHRSARRLSWLSVNIFLNMISASVIAFYQDTLAAAIALAVFLPIISDMSGCAGSQSVAVSIRELTLGMIRPSEVLRVLAKELSMGMLNGLVLGILLSLLAIVWKGNVWLGAVVGTALMLNTLLAACLGGLLPLVLRRLRMDPALASAPILTTVTDMCGFFFVLSFASMILPRLAG